jgi:hydroxyacylglutathione hydrolase
VGGLTGVVLETPGHCADHIAYHFAREKVAFVGDVLFALGCGRVFDEQYDAMWASLRKIAALPPATELYFGHEYTLSNGKFALAVDPGNADLKAQVERAETVRARGDFTIPTTVAAERAANPFLRAVLPGMAAQLGMPGAPAAAVFRELRERKNRF